MIPSTHIQRLNDMFTGVTNGEWTWFACGAVAGIALWVGFYRHIISQLFHKLKTVTQKEIVTILFQSVTGAVIIYPNVLLVNYGEIHRNFMIAALGLTGILFGLWVFIPGEKQSK